MKDKITPTYKKLIQLCIYDENDKSVLLNKIEDIVNQATLENTLYELDEFSIENNIPFFLGVDSGQGFWDNRILQEFTYEILQKQFPTYDVILPDHLNYEDTKWINFRLLVDNDIALRKYNLQYSYFEDENYDYLTIIHKTTDRDEIHALMTNIDCKLFEYDRTIDPT